MNEAGQFFSDDFFEEGPNRDAQPLGLPVMRAPQKGALVLTILSSKLLGCWTHFYRKRTQPCLGSECPICPQENTRRWYGWLVAYDTQRRTKCLLEVPAGVAMQLKEYRAERGDLRGHGIKLARKNDRANGPVCAMLAPPKFDVGLLPACPDIVALMCRMWQIKAITAEEVRRSNIQMFPADEDDTLGATA